MSGATADTLWQDPLGEQKRLLRTLPDCLLPPPPPLKLDGTGDFERDLEAVTSAESNINV